MEKKKKIVEVVSHVRLVQCYPAAKSTLTTPVELARIVTFYLDTRIEDPRLVLIGLIEFVIYDDWASRKLMLHTARSCENSWEQHSVLQLFNIHFKPRQFPATSFHTADWILLAAISNFPSI